MDKVFQEEVIEYIPRKPWGMDSSNYWILSPWFVNMKLISSVISIEMQLQK